MEETTRLIRNRYRVVKHLGAGGEGSVFLVEDRLLGQRLVALKAFFAAGLKNSAGPGPSTQPEDPGPEGATLVDQAAPRIEQRLLREFQVLASLDHPLLGQVHDFGRLPPGLPLPVTGGATPPGGGFFMTRDFVAGLDLWVASRGKSPAEIAALGAAACEALEVLHRANLVHGDLKPANAIVDPAGRVRLIDFGLARGVDEGSGQVGTLGYMAPEILRGEPSDPRSDLYALGITLYQLLVGRLPARGTPMALAYWHLNGPPASLREGGAEVGDDLEALVRRLTERRPEARLPTASETAMALRAAAARAHHSASGRGSEGGSGEWMRVMPGKSPRPASGPTGGGLQPPQGASFTAALEALGRLLRLRLGLLEPEVPEELDQASIDLSPPGALVGLSGEAGTGTQTLLRALRWQAQLAGAEALHTGWRELAPPGEGPVAALIGQLEGLLGDEHPLVRSRRQPGVRPVAEEGPAVSASRYAQYEATAQLLLAAAADQPLLVTFGGLDAADDSARALVRYLAHRVTSAQVMLVAAYAPGHAVEPYLAGFADVSMGGLVPAEVTAFLARTSGRTPDLLGEISARVYERTAGNPLFVAEVAQVLARAGWPPLAALDLVKLPAALGEALAAQLVDLSPGARVLLEELAVEGGEKALPSQAHPARALALRELEELRLATVRDGRHLVLLPGPAGRLVYDRLDPELRRHLHAEAAERARAEGRLAQAVRHALRAGALEQALGGAAEALEQLRAGGAHHAALDLTEELLEAVSPGARPGWAQRLALWAAEGASRVGDYARARRHLERLPESGAGAFERNLLLGQVLAAQSDPAAIAALEQALARAEATASGERWRAQLELARALYRHGRHGEARELLQGALDEPGPPGHRAFALARAELCGLLGLVEEQLGHAEAADRALQDALALLGPLTARPAGAVDGASALDPARLRAALTVMNYAAICAYRRGQLRLALERYDVALDHARAVGDVERIASLQLNLATLRYHLGDYPAYLEAATESARLFRALDLSAHLFSVLHGLAPVHAQLGLIEQARQLARELAVLAERAGTTQSRAAAHHCRGFVELRAAGAEPAALERARRELLAAVPLFAGLGERREETDALLDLVELELEAGQPAEAGARLEQAERTLDPPWPLDLEARCLVLRVRLGDPAAGRLAPSVEAVLTRYRSEGPGGELLLELLLTSASLAAAGGDPALAQARRAEASALIDEMTARLGREQRTSFLADPRRQRQVQSCQPAQGP